MWHATRKARMPVVNIYPGCINGVLCNNGRPARPIYLAGRCWPCWSSMTGEERRAAVWEADLQSVVDEAKRIEALEEAEQPTEDWEVVELLRALETMAEFDGPRHFRDAA